MMIYFDEASEEEIDRVVSNIIEMYKVEEAFAFSEVRKLIEAIGADYYNPHKDLFRYRYAGRNRISFRPFDRLEKNVGDKFFLGILKRLSLWYVGASIKLLKLEKFHEHSDFNKLNEEELAEIVCEAIAISEDENNENICDKAVTVLLQHEKYDSLSIVLRFLNIYDLKIVVNKCDLTKFRADNLIYIQHRFSEEPNSPEELFIASILSDK